MKRVFVYVFALFLAASVFCGCFAASPLKKKVSEKQKIEFTTRDGFILVGDLYLANNETGKPLVVCLHSFSMNSGAWERLANELKKAGYNVLAMDLRGHGRSVYNKQLKVKSRYAFTSADWQYLPKDVIQSINYVKNNYSKVNCNEIIIVGADLGASAGVLASVTFPQTPKKMVLISPVSNFKGLIMPVKVDKFYDTKMLYITTKTDRIFLNFNLKTPPVIKQYPLGGPGTQLIKVNYEAVSDIVNFISK